MDSLDYLREIGRKILRAKSLGITETLYYNAGVISSGARKLSDLVEELQSNFEDLKLSDVTLGNRFMTLIEQIPAIVMAQLGLLALEYIASDGGNHLFLSSKLKKINKLCRYSLLPSMAWISLYFEELRNQIGCELPDDVVELTRKNAMQRIEAN